MEKSNKEKQLFNKENAVVLKQQEDGSFKCESSHDILPLFVVNEILSQLHGVYNNMMFNKAYNNLPEKHKEYQQFLEKRLRSQKRWTLFWYCVAIAVLVFFIG